jgi:uncharacterized membrane protein YeiH
MGTLSILTVLGYIGDIAFVVGGIIAARRVNLRPFWQFWSGMSTAFFGGIFIRDLGLLHTMPSIFGSPIEIAATAAAGIATIVAMKRMGGNGSAFGEILMAALNITDSIGIAGFAAFGYGRGIMAGAAWGIAFACGFVTACGGGVIASAIMAAAANDRKIFFCEPGTDIEWFTYWRTFCKNWLVSHGISEKSLRLRDHSPEELSHYSNATTDIEFMFPFGWGELWGIADRTDFDLAQHSKHSGQKMADKDTGVIPYCIEPSLGADRVTLAFLCEAYDEEQISENDTRVVLRLHPSLAPIKAAVLPLSKKLVEPARQLYRQLSQYFMCDYDDTASIGKRYRRQDEIGTPLCITFDYDSPSDDAVTVRFRDTMKQERIAISELCNFMAYYIG